MSNQSINRDKSGKKKTHPSVWKNHIPSNLLSDTGEGETDMKERLCPQDLMSCLVGGELSGACTGRRPLLEHTPLWNINGIFFLSSPCSADLVVYLPSANVQVHTLHALPYFLLKPSHMLCTTHMLHALPYYHIQTTSRSHTTNFGFHQAFKPWHHTCGGSLDALGLHSAIECNQCHM